MDFKPDDDGLVIPEVGPWAKQKYHFLGRYLHMFSTGMKNMWPERHYIDLFAGAGFARIRGTSEVVCTSAILAATQTDPFTSIHCCDSNERNIEALDARFRRSGTTARWHLHTSDANESIRTILRNVPTQRTLCITFADPFGLHFDFETARAISERQSDLIVLLADSMDALRNWQSYYFNNPNSTLDRFMGEPGWRDTLSTGISEPATRLRSRYRERLKSLGFTYFGEQRIQNSADRDIYTLFYATRHKRGLDFWNKATQRDAAGQPRLPFA